VILWIDAQISPAMAPWLRMRFDLDATPVGDLGLREAEDERIFRAAKDAAAVVMTKDSDFITLLDRLGPPPQVVWLRSGNTSNARLKQILTHAMPVALELLRSGESLVEIGDAW
jgi:predicted nuclease of predicted toxin-antitoxin system